MNSPPVLFSAVSDSVVVESLEKAGLGGVLQRLGGLDVEFDKWNSILSPGEAQRVAFARLFCRNPPFAGREVIVEKCDADRK